MIPDEAAKSVRQLTLRVKELEAHIARTRAALICAFNQMLDLKDLNTGCHSTRLAEWGVRVARDLGAEHGRELRHLRITAEADQDVREVDPGCADLDELLPVGGFRLGHLLDDELLRPADGLQDGGSQRPVN